jgi:hypothetical protein
VLKLLGGDSGPSAGQKHGAVTPSPEEEVMSPEPVAAITNCPTRQGKERPMVTIPPEPPGTEQVWLSDANC